MKNNDDETGTVIRRFLLMGMVSVCLHGIIAAVLFIGTSPAKGNNIYRVELKRLQPMLEHDWNNARNILETEGFDGYELYPVGEYDWNSIPAGLISGIHSAFLSRLTPLLDSGRPATV